MTGLVFDRRLGPDADSLHEIVTLLSDRLRSHPRLRGALDRIVGNRWQEFEEGLEQFLSALMARTGDHGGGILALYEAFPELTPAHVMDACDLFMETAMTVLPLHSAASLAELSDSIGELVLKALQPGGGPLAALPLAGRLREVDEALRSGAGLR